MAIWSPDWPAVAAAREARMPVGRPIAVLSANRVLACSEQARIAGVRRGLRRREAQGRCPDLLVYQDNPDRDATEFEQVVTAIDAVAPGLEVMRAGLVVLSSRGVARYHGGEAAAMEKIIDAVTVAGVECQVGIADEMPTAVIAARYGVPVPPKGSRSFLAPLAIDIISAEPALGDAQQRGELVPLLRRLGIRTLGDYAALSARDIATRFGPVATAAHRMAAGEPYRPPSPDAIPPDLEIDHSCQPPIDNVEVAAFLGRSLAQSLHEGLASAGVACIRLAISAILHDGSEIFRTWRCVEPLTPDSTADRIRWQLDAWITGRASASDSGGAIASLRLTPVEVIPAGDLQLSLWGESGLGDARARQVLSRVQALLGTDSVCVPVAAGGRSPTDRIELVSYGECPRSTNLPSDPWPGALPSPLPSIVWTERQASMVMVERAASALGDYPRSVELLCASGVLVSISDRGHLSGRPAVVEAGNQRWPVAFWSSPWLLDENWWEARTVTKLAWLQVQPEGMPSLLLAYRRRENQETGQVWTVEGVYR